MRFRRSSGDERQQIRWLAYVGLVGLVVMVATFASEPFEAINNLLFFLFFVILAVGIPAAIGIAILKYRLYGFDLVVRRTLVFGALAAVITAIYLGVVVLIGTIATESLVPSLIATAIVAALFQPIRRRVVHLADRLVFGRRAEPYEVLARFSDRVGASYAADDVIPRTARVIAEGVGATHVEIWLQTGGEAHLAAAWPDEDVPSTDPDVRPIASQERSLGEIRLWTAPGQPLRPAEEKLVTDLAAQTALVVRNLALTSELRARVDELSRRADELRDSRMRIVQAHDAERRRLERNIHDGAQQHLVALAVKLRLAGAMAAKEPEKAAGQLRDLGDQTDLALTTLLDLASGIYPAELEEQGIGPALSTLGRSGRAPDRDRHGRCRPPSDRDRGGDLLRLPRGDAERREVREGFGGPRRARARGRRDRVPRSRRRHRFRHDGDLGRHRAPEHAGSAGHVRRRRRHLVDAGGRHDSVRLARGAGDGAGVSERAMTRSARWARIVHVGSLVILALVLLAIGAGVPRRRRGRGRAPTPSTWSS